MSSTKIELAIAIRSATGIEALICLTDIAGLSRDVGADVLHWSARAMLQTALSGQTTPAIRSRPRRRGRRRWAAL